VICGVVLEIGVEVRRVDSQSRLILPEVGVSLKLQFGNACFASLRPFHTDLYDTNVTQQIMRRERTQIRDLYLNFFTVIFLPLFVFLLLILSST
jgi:hypothetical protein